MPRPPHVPSSPAWTAEHLAAAVRAGRPSRAARPSRVIASTIVLTLLLAFWGTLAWTDALPYADDASTSTSTVRSNAAHGASGTAISGAAEPSSADSEADGAIRAHWDGAAVHLDWTGSEYARAEATFVGDRVATPGDRVSRRLVIVNSGPGDAVMTAELHAAVTVPEGALNPHLDDDVRVFWSVDGRTGDGLFSSWRSGRPVALADVEVDRGASVEIMVGFEMDTAVETSRSFGEASTQLRFDLDVRMRGDEYAGRPPLALTGGSPPVAAVAVALGLLGLGWVLLVRARRRSDRSIG